jgi:hypothetical protein
MQTQQAVTNWFRDVFGMEEGTPDSVRRAFCMVGKDATAALEIKHTGKRLHVGAWRCMAAPELRLLRAGLPPERLQRLGVLVVLGAPAAPAAPAVLPYGLTFRHIAADVGHLLHDGANAGAVFQVASQFNCLEMTGPHVTPAHGVTRYALDKTQGPRCAIACPAATVYRNYFVDGGKGQCGGDGVQVNLLSRVEELLHPDVPWAMTNGYCLPRGGCGGGGGGGANPIAALGARLRSFPELRDAVRDAVKVGIHWSTGVGVGAGPARVTQVLCSGVPVSYTAPGTPAAAWQPFAQLVLDAAYECTLLTAATIAAARGCRVRVFLTKLGAGAFGNPDEWVMAAIARALRLVRHEPLDVELVHYGSVSKDYLGRLPDVTAAATQDARRSDHRATRAARDAQCSLKNA